MPSASRTEPAAQTARAESPQQPTAEPGAVGTAGQREDPGGESARSALPRTAGSTVLLQLLSGFALGGGVLLRGLRQGR